MKVIDLLNKIAKGEEVPKKIRFDNINWNKVYGEKYMYYKNEYNGDFFLYFFRKNLDFTLNDEVEIIEEDKKIKKLKHTKEDVLLFSCYGARGTGKSYYEKLKEKVIEIERLNNIINELERYINEEYIYDELGMKIFDASKLQDKLQELKGVDKE